MPENNIYKVKQKRFTPPTNSPKELTNNIGTPPRNLYPGWPVSTALGRDNIAHAMVQALAQRVFEESQRTSISDVAARCGMTASTVSDIVNGVCWPTVETLARLEVGLEKPLWPRVRQNN